MKVLRLFLPALAAFMLCSAPAAVYAAKNGNTFSSTKADLVGSTAEAKKTPKTSAFVAAQSTDNSASSATVITPASGRAYIRSAASRYLGIRYIHGGTGGGGIDCSGYTMRVFQQLGVRLPRTASAQWHTGYSVNSRNLQAGDLVFFNTTGAYPSHVAVYLGNGMMAGANSYYGRTMVEPLFSNPYWAARYIGARRVLR